MNPNKISHIAGAGLRVKCRDEKVSTCSTELLEVSRWTN